MTNGANNEGQDSQLGNEPKKENQDLELLKKDLAGKDSKITELLKAQKELADKIEASEKDRVNKEFATKTAEEKLSEYEKRVKSFERKEAFRESFKGVGLNPDDFDKIVNETDPKKQASAFNELLKKQLEENSNKTLENFKLTELAKVRTKTPDPKDKDVKDEVFEQARQAAQGR